MKIIWLLLLTCQVLLGCSSPSDSTEPDGSLDKPDINGLMVFHSYSSYDARDSRLYVYDFSSDMLSEISLNWKTVIHPMNGHFSPDGKELVFMGIGTSSNSWDLFRYTIRSDAEPELLTTGSSDREEDPKYAPDGKSIVYKKDGQLYQMNLADKHSTAITYDTAFEYSMPYFTSDMQWVICSKGARAKASIVKVNLKTGQEVTVCDRQEILDYYPITIDQERFYFTSHYSAENAHDQIYLGYLDGRFPVRFNFNTSDADYSDPYPVNSDWLLLCSTRSDSQGGYDLYIAHTQKKIMYSLSDYNSFVNTTGNELGAAVYLRSK